MTVIPSALHREEEIHKNLAGKTPFLFLDYDGTLTPIVDRPDQAVLRGNMRKILSTLSKTCRVAIISGRKREEIEKLVGIPGLTYAGTHGFDIRGPQVSRVPPEVLPLRPLIESIYQKLHEKTENIAGCLVEDKKFAIAVHYRLVDPTRVPDIEKLVNDMALSEGKLKKTTGKMVFELRANIPWDKGAALLFLLKTLGGQNSHPVPIYLGDDDTDEDAFKVISNFGIGILVTETPKPTAARYFLKNPLEVEEFLSKLAHWLEGNVS